MAVMPARSFGQTQAFGQSIQRASRSRELEEHAAHLEQYLATQHAITQIIARSSDLDRALPRILQAICETTDWDFGEVWHIDPRDNLLNCAATWCAPASNFPAFEKSGWDFHFAFGKGLPGRVWASDAPAWVTNVAYDTNFLRADIAEQDGVHAGVGIPIRTDGEVIGVMTFFSRQRRRADRELVQMLDTVGSQIGLFIERKRIEQSEREQARMVVMLEERQRLARELHDSVTQSLFSASVIAEMLPLLYDRDPEQVKLNLDDLQHLTRSALSEMRSLLVELRPPSLIQGGLADLLKNLTDALRDRSKISVSLDVQITAALTPDEQTALYRITQEALHNITKHAAATCVTVQLHAAADQLELTITDNGDGFDPMCVPIAHFGVEGMGERARGIGAELQIDSAPGAGTRLCVVRTITRTRPITP